LFQALILIILFCKNLDFIIFLLKIQRLIHGLGLWKNKGEAGLKNVKVECMEENCCADSAEGCEIANVSLFVASGEKL